MKYNLDCARDVLFFLEEKLTISPDLEICCLDYQDIAAHLDNYEISEIVNTLLVLTEAGFIDANTFYAENCIDELLVSRITYEGYQFIESIRPETVWNKIKSIGSKVGSLSTNAISQIALGTVTALINAQLSL